MPAELHSDPADALRERLRQHPADRHPLQHATAQFHLGGVLLERNALDEAEEAFTTAAALFGARGARPEQAKALNGLGATLRAAGRLDLAARALGHAASGLAAAALPLDEGAARFNLGLVLRESGRGEDAVAALVRATELLDPDHVPAQAAAAARELAAAQLTLGRPEEAEATLARAVALADRARDEAGRAAAANTLGLARLARGDATAAAEAFGTAVQASPRSVRPEAFAMANANLALALERTGVSARARLAARQALAAAGDAAAVRAQAEEVVDRLGPGEADLRIVLEDELDDERRARIVRDELARSLDAGESERTADMREWVLAHRSERLEPAAVAEIWLGGLLELPPDALELMAHSAIRAAAMLGGEEREEFREGVTRAMARFHVPQLMRLQEVFTRAAEDIGDPGPWR